MRTTVDIEKPILQELKRLQKTEGKSLGRLISDILAGALHARRHIEPGAPPPRWIVREMRPRVDLADKDALYAAMEAPPPEVRKDTT